MIIASLNGTHGQGFVEIIERGDGSVERLGRLKLSATSAKRLQRWFDCNEPLTYAGPVFSNGRWLADTFPILATQVITERDSPDTVAITLSSIEPAIIAHG